MRPRETLSDNERAGKGSGRCQLSKKYGGGLAAIRKALRDLVKADKARGIVLVGKTIRCRGEVHGQTLILADWEELEDEGGGFVSRAGAFVPPGSSAARSSFVSAAAEGELLFVIETMIVFPRNFRSSGRQGLYGTELRAEVELSRSRETFAQGSVMWSARAARFSLAASSHLEVVCLCPAWKTSKKRRR